MGDITAHDQDVGGKQLQPGDKKRAHVVAEGSEEALGRLTFLRRFGNFFHSFHLLPTQLFIFADEPPGGKIVVYDAILIGQVPETALLRHVFPLYNGDPILHVSRTETGAQRYGYHFAIAFSLPQPGNPHRKGGRIVQKPKGHTRRLQEGRKLLLYAHSIERLVLVVAFKQGHAGFVIEWARHGKADACQPGGVNFSNSGVQGPCPGLQYFRFGGFIVDLDISPRIFYNFTFAGVDGGA